MERSVIFYFKGQPFYLDIMDENLKGGFLKKHPALEFYRHFLKTRISGTFAEILDFYTRPKGFEDKKRVLSKLTDEEIAQFRKQPLAEGNIRFLIDADPFYLLFIARKKQTDPRNENLDLVTIYKKPLGQYKIANEG